MLSRLNLDHGLDLTVMAEEKSESGYYTHDVHIYACFLFVQYAYLVAILVLNINSKEYIVLRYYLKLLTSTKLNGMCPFYKNNRLGLQSFLAEGKGDAYKIIQHIT